MRVAIDFNSQAIFARIQQKVNCSPSIRGRELKHAGPESAVSFNVVGQFDGAPCGLVIVVQCKACCHMPPNLFIG